MTDDVIRYSFADSSLGSVLVAASGTGVCAVFLGDDRAALAADLRARFPDADIRAADLGDWPVKVAALVENPAGAFDLPLDLRGTPFQRRVWDELRRIPPGETTTYTKLAHGLGRPTAARAVARACATNHVSVVVPCHRVVRTDESLAGYRWGVDRKAELLKREAPSNLTPQPPSLRGKGASD